MTLVTAIRRHHVIGAIATTAILGAVWLWTATTDHWLVVSLPEMFARFGEVWFFDRFTSDALPSLKRFAIGYGLAVLIGVAGGLCLGVFAVMRALFMPAVHFVRAIPAIALLGPAIIVLGVGDKMNISLIVFVCVWPILLNTADGVTGLDLTMLSSARAYGITGWRRLVRVVVPATMPRALAGMRISLTFALLVMVVTEFVGSPHGIGAFLVLAQQTYQIPDMWAAVLLLGFLGVALNGLFTLVERRLIFWHGQSTPAE